MPAPGDAADVAPERDATLGWVLFGGRTDAERRQRLSDNVEERLRTVGTRRSLAEAGVARAELEAALPDLARTTFDEHPDQPTDADDPGDRRAAPGRRRKHPVSCAGR